MTTAADPFAAVGAGDRHRAYRALAATGPVHRIVLPTGVPAWLVTGYPQVRAVLNDPRLLKFAASPTAALMQRERPDLSRAMDTNMICLDGPEHTRLRRLVGAVFTRRRVEAFAPRIQRIVDDLLDALPRDEPADLVAGFAYPLPMTVICEMVGIPERDRDELRRMFVTIANGPPFVTDAACIAAADAMIAMFRALIAERRADPGDDLVSGLVGVREGTDQLSGDELTSMLFLLLAAGHETTVNLIANGVYALLTHPDQLDRLRSRPDLISSAVEELLRFDSPLQVAIPLRAAAPLDLDGTPIEAGEIVIAGLLAANRDPDRMPGTDRLDIARDPNPHLAFGHGVHHCLGAPLARMEGRIALTGLLARYPGIRLAVPAERLTYQPSFIFHGLAALPVILS
jgi:cytochrome P450